MTRVESFTGEHPETVIKNTMIRLFNPVIFFARCSGISMGPALDEDRSVDTYKDGRLHTFYCVVTSLILWANTCCRIYKLVILETFSSDWIQTFQFFILNAVASVLSTTASLITHNGFFHNWVKQLSLYEHACGTNDRSELLMKRVKVIIAAVIFIGLASPGVFLTLAITVPECRANYVLFQDSMTWLNYISTYINSQLVLVSYYSLLTLAVIGSFPLCYDLDKINKLLAQMCERDTADCNDQETTDIMEVDHVKSTEVSNMIRRHERICGLISGYSRCVNYGFFTSFFVTLPIVCFNLYILLMRAKTSFDVSICLVVLGMCSLPAILLCFTGARINIKAHESLEHMWKIRTADLSDKTMREVILFTNKLTGTSVGVSVYGFFTINPPTLLTTIGTLITYMVVVLQLSPPDQGQCSSGHLDLIANLTMLLQEARST